MGAEIQLTYSSVGRQANMSPQISLPTEFTLKMPEAVNPDMTFSPTFSPAFSPTFSPSFSPTLPALSPHFHVTVEPTPFYNHISLPKSDAAIVNITNILPTKAIATICFANTLVFASLSYLIHWLNIFRQ